MVLSSIDEGGDVLAFGIPLLVAKSGTLSKPRGPLHDVARYP
jgi:hypothetical protein